jgi:nitroreductase
MTDSGQGTNDLWEALSTQRAIRRFRPDPVPDAILRKVIEAATRAPSGSNLQPWRFIVVRDPATRMWIADRIRSAPSIQEMLRTRVAEAERSEDRTRRLMYRGVGHLVEHFGEIPVLILPCLYQVESPARDGLLAGSSIYQAVQNMLLAARGLGLGALMTTFQSRIPGLDAHLGLPADASIAAIIPLGFTDAKYGPTSRKPVEEVTFADRWGQPFGH